MRCTIATILAFIAFFQSTLAQDYRCYEDWLKKGDEHSSTGKYNEAINAWKSAPNECTHVKQAELDQRIRNAELKICKVADNADYERISLSDTLALRSHIKRTCCGHKETVIRIINEQRSIAKIAAQKQREAAAKLAERLEQERLEQERLKQERLEKERLEKARIERDAAAWKDAVKHDNLGAYTEYLGVKGDKKCRDTALLRKNILEKMAVPGFIEMVSFSGGEFEMGNVSVMDTAKGEISELKWHATDEKKHKVRVRSFSIARLEMSFSVFDLYCVYEGRTLPSDTLWGRGEMPVINISWYDAVLFCNWLSRHTGLAEYYRITPLGPEAYEIKIKNRDANGYRLPTEAEWEYAARNGGGGVFFGNRENKADPGKINFDTSKSGSANNLMDDEKNWTGSSARKTVSTRSMVPKRTKLYHMSGNVREWCWDGFHRNYNTQTEVSDNPEGDPTSSTRVAKGGSWFFGAEQCRVSARANHKPALRSWFIGFRVARNR